MLHMIGHMMLHMIFAMKVSGFWGRVVAMGRGSPDMVCMPMFADSGPFMVTCLPESMLLADVDVVVAAVANPPRSSGSIMMDFIMARANLQ